MGREIRRVPADWCHPKREDGFYVPLRDGETFVSDLFRHREEVNEYRVKPGYSYSVEEWCGRPPCPDDYMPLWQNHERTHLQMYETCTEGTPISPVFVTPEEVARWCADNGASSFGSQTASYEAWLQVARGGFACSAVAVGGGPLVSGVEALAHE